MSLAVGRSKLLAGLKELNLKWEKTTAVWDDAMSRDVQQTVLEPLEPRVRAAVVAMEKMAEVLARARRDCE